MKNDVTQTTPTKGKPTPKNNEKPGFLKRTGRSIKETFGELKKVTWPSFGEAMKQLGAVIAVVLCFLVVLTLFDFVLGQGFNQFKKALGDDTSAVRALITLLTSRL